MAQGDVTCEVCDPSGDGAYFDGVNDELSLVGTNISASNEITISFWTYPLKFTGESGADDCFTLSKYNWAGNIRGFWMYHKATGFGGPIGNGTGHSDAIVNKAFTAKTWYHIAITIHNTPVGRLELYVNGEYIGYAESTHPYENNVNDSLLIACGSVNDREYNAVIDDFRMFERRLSAGEIKSIYRGEGKVGGMLLWYPFSNTASIGQDFSGNGYDATVTGAVSAAGYHSLKHSAKYARVAAGDRWNFVPMADGNQVMMVHIEEV